MSGEQVHGINVAVVGKEAAGRGALSIKTALPATDGLISRTPGLLLAACFADCVPVFFVDPAVPAVGIAHSGWRGTLGGIVERMVDQFQAAFDTPPHRLKVWLGPAMGRAAIKWINRWLSNSAVCPLFPAELRLCGGVEPIGLTCGSSIECVCWRQA